MLRYLYTQRLALSTYARAGKTLSSKHVFTHIVRRKSLLPLSRVVKRARANTRFDCFYAVHDFQYNITFWLKRGIRLL